MTKILDFFHSSIFGPFARVIFDSNHEPYRPFDLSTSWVRGSYLTQILNFSTFDLSTFWPGGQGSYLTQILDLFDLSTFQPFDHVIEGYIWPTFWTFLTFRPFDLRIRSHISLKSWTFSTFRPRGYLGVIFNSNPERFRPFDLSTWGSGIIFFLNPGTFWLFDLSTFLPGGQRILIYYNPRPFRHFDQMG